MSLLTQIDLAYVRCQRQARYDFVPGVNAIVGPNGSGKTTVLEALYLSMRGQTFRGQLTELLQYGQTQFNIKLKLQTKTSHQRSLCYQHDQTLSRKKWQLDNKTYQRLPLSARLPVVLFEPDIGRLVTGSPAHRRRYIDGLAAQLSLETARQQRQLERVLTQRNHLLKSLAQGRRPELMDELFIWNTQLAQLAQQVVISRLAVITQLQAQLSTYYRQLGGQDNVFVAYQSPVEVNGEQYASRLLEFLETSLARDIALGYTSFGPHRDDLELLLADQPAAQRASRGEVRSLVIAAKLLEIEILASSSLSNGQPILLLDDVLSELDLDHQAQVLNGFKDYQVFLTTTDAHTLTPGTHTIALVA